MIQSAQYSIDGTAVKISAASQTPRHVYIHVTVGTLYINGSNAVTVNTGLLLDKAAGVTLIQMDSDDELWAIGGLGTHTVSVLERLL